MKRRLGLTVMVGALLFQGCSLIGAKVLSPNDVVEATVLMEKIGGSGCAWLRSEANPPAASVDLDFIYSWGDVSYLDCIKTLREQ